jgi:hypothetical protein
MRDEYDFTAGTVGKYVGRVMSRFTHLVCEDCWKQIEPGRVPVRVIDSRTNECCFCGQITNSGIFVRRNPADLSCNAERGIHANQT